MVRWLDSSRFAVVVVGAGVVVRLALLAYVGRFPLASDSLSYHQISLGILGGGEFGVYYPPGVSFALAGLYGVFGASELIARVSGLFWYVAFSIGLLALARDIFSRTIANATLLVFSLYPVFVWHSVEPLSQLPGATCVVAACYLTLRLGREPRWWLAVLLGALLGVGVLIRSSMIVLVAAVPLYLLFAWRWRWLAAIPVLVSLVIVGSWLVKAHQMTGRFVMVAEANTINLFFGNNPYTPLYRTWWLGSHHEGEPGVPDEFSAMLNDIRDEPMQVQKQRYLDIVVDHVLARPDLFLVRSFNRMRTFFAFDTMAGSALRSYYGASTAVALLVIGVDALLYCLVLFGAAVFLCLYVDREMFRRGVGLLLIVTVVYAVPYWLSFAHPTYHIPVVPLLAIMAVALLVKIRGQWRNLAERITALSRRRRYTLLALGLFLLYIQIEWVVFGLARV